MRLVISIGLPFYNGYGSKYRWPHQVDLTLPAVTAIVQPESISDIQIRSNTSEYVPWYGISFKRSFLIIITHHQPWPSRSIPHGNPSSLLHRRNEEQKMLSKFQIRKPIAIELIPQAIIIHIFRRISLLSRTIRSWSSALRDPIERGRSVLSITYILRKTTMMVSKANMFW